MKMKIKVQQKSKMPLNCKTITLAEVVKFFVIDIDGMGIRDGFLRNLDTPGSLERCREWVFCELTEDEFAHLTIPDGTSTLIKDKELDTNEGNSKSTILKYLENLKMGNDIPPLIVRSVLQGEREGSSFYIKDGAHRAIALKVYFESNSYKSVKAYVGRREN